MQIDNATVLLGNWPQASVVQQSWDGMQCTCDGKLVIALLCRHSITDLAMAEFSRKCTL